MLQTTYYVSYTVLYMICYMLHITSYTLHIDIYIHMNYTICYISKNVSKLVIHVLLYFMYSTLQTVYHTYVHMYIYIFIYAYKFMCSILWLLSLLRWHPYCWKWKIGGVLSSRCSRDDQRVRSREKTRCYQGAKGPNSSHAFRESLRTAFAGFSAHVDSGLG